ncbi:MAG: Unknown protein [uncultured Thiotrichaceae bacterium]|uniref:Integral membrane protein TerC n=1 Tax=uncultured Thiotrichaceae bacterium TaxID=298394 RepID=A0A6S6T2W3_9GAMM|nr:MAG: Unknown protein [uncultured Thiotrichaceae bacterium]
MEWLFDLNLWSAFITLTILEIVLGIDNIIFLTLMVNKLPEKQRPVARRFGLLVAMITRIMLLVMLAWIAKLTVPIFEIGFLNDHPVSWRDLILFFGGLFLLYSAVTEIHSSLEGEEETSTTNKAGASFVIIMMQIAVLDIIFSLDSVITAIGLADEVMVMIAAIVVAIGVMMFAADGIGRFIEEHPSVKMLALAFLVMVGAILVAEGLGHHVPKGYLYFAIAFSLGVEFLNIRMKKKRAATSQPVTLRKHH